MSLNFDNNKPYNLSTLEELGDKQSMLEILEMFLTNTSAEVDTFLYDVENQNWEKAYKAAHKLRGSVGVLQAHKLIDLFKQIELHTKATEKDAPAINLLAQEIISSFSELKNLLKIEYKQIKESK
jgi:HPt (histidine-containing phosphotransfer) domain-containing protein